MKENLQITGQLDLVLLDSQGLVKDKRTIKNLVVNTGLNYIASRMVGTSFSTMSHMGLGSSGIAVAAAQTSLQTQVGSRKALTSSNIVGALNNQIEYVATFSPGEATGSLQEAAIFNASTGGTMLCRVTFGTVTKDAPDTLTMTWTVSIAAA